MNTLVVASLQMGMNMPLTRKEFRADFERHLKVAAAKNCDLVVGAELGAAMIVLPFIDLKHRESLLHVRKGQSPAAGLLMRLRGSAEKLNPRWSEADTQRLLMKTLRAQKKRIWAYYDRTFSELAAQYRMVLVAPSAWLADPLDGVIRNIAAVYDADGSRLGYQAKVLLNRGEGAVARPGNGWQPIPTSIGPLGVSLGHDGLLPEVGRIFATRGSILLASLVASASDVQWGRSHRAAVMRGVENQLFGCLSCLVGPDRLDEQGERTYRGRSMLLAPLELSPQKNGVLVTMEEAQRQGMVVSALDYRALRESWSASDPEFRAEFQHVWDLYASSQAVTEESDRLLSEQSLGEDMATDSDVTIVEAEVSAEEPTPEVGMVRDLEPEEEPATEDGVLLEASTLDDLDVVHSLVMPWTDDQADGREEIAKEPRPAYDPRGNLEDTREMEALDRRG